ncbi:ADP-ribosyltransferase, partial [Streptomyces sp. NPDC059489]|uniref:ADP-ribosyltransferase n=1 Tax=Streptomyces sp. NPDC059489 TaxID=3346849 RepID=UPI0036BE7F0E
GHWVKSFVWDGLIVDGVWGTIKGLGTLVGFGGWEAMGQAWKGLAQLATGLVISSMPGAGALFWALPDDKLPSWLRDSRTAMKETGKALVAWDEWGKNPARAAGAVTFNVLTTVFTGGAGGAASGAGKAGAVAKALSLAGKAGKVIDPMTYVAKGAGAGLSKIGDISKALKGVGNIEIPKLPDGSVHLPDGRLLDADGNLIGHDGTIDTTPAPHEVVPGLPADWTIQEPALSGVRAGDGVPDGIHGHAPSGTFDGPPATYDHAPPTAPHGHAPAPSTFDHTSTATPHGHAPAAFEHTPTATPHDAPAATPHPGSGHDLPHGSGHDTPNGHGDDGAHGSGHDQHDGAAHDHHGGEHDGSGHDGDHTDLGHDGVDAAAHHGTDASATPGHPGTDPLSHSGGGEPFEYKPSMSEREFARLGTDAEKHAVATAELADGTNPVPSASNKAGFDYGNGYWNDFLDNLTSESRESLVTYTGNAYDDINGHLRFGTDTSAETLHTIDEMDNVMGARPVPEDIMVVRGTGVDHLHLPTPMDMRGGVYDDKAYTSTALGKTPPPPFDAKPVWMHLRVPKGTPALWLDHLSKYPGERELLLARGTEYKVTRVFMDEAGKWHVYGEVLPRP